MKFIVAFLAMSSLAIPLRLTAQSTNRIAAAKRVCNRRCTSNANFNANLATIASPRSSSVLESDDPKLNSDARTAYGRFQPDWPTSKTGFTVAPLYL